MDRVGAPYRPPGWKYAIFVVLSLGPAFALAYAVSFAVGWLLAILLVVPVSFGLAKLCERLGLRDWVMRPPSS